MKGWNGSAATVLALALGCGGAPEAKSVRDRLPENIVLRVDRVGVAPTQSGTQNRWDGAEGELRGDAVCSLVAIGTNLVSPVAGEGVQGLCGAMMRVEHLERFAAGSGPAPPAQRRRIGELRKVPWCPT